MSSRARLLLVMLLAIGLAASLSPAKAAAPRFVCAQIVFPSYVPVLGDPDNHFPNPICLVAGILCPHCTAPEGIETRPTG